MKITAKVQFSSIFVDGVKLTDEKDIANGFTVFVTSVAESISADIQPTVRPPEPAPQPNIPIFNCANVPITSEEITNVVTDLKGKKSEDLNGIPIIPIFKNGDPLCFDNYCFISLLL